MNRGQLPIVPPADVSGGGLYGADPQFSSAHNSGNLKEKRRERVSIKRENLGGGFEYYSVLAKAYLRSPVLGKKVPGKGRVAELPERIVD